MRGFWEWLLVAGFCVLALLYVISHTSLAAR
jgi:hypothetical protein